MIKKSIITIILFLMTFIAYASDLRPGGVNVGSGGTVNYLPRFLTPFSIGNSDVTDDGITITLGPSMSRKTVIDGNGTNSLDIENGHVIAPYADSIRSAPWNISGGGQLMWGVTTSSFSWNANMYAIGVGIGAQATTTGYYAIIMPGVGVPLNVIGGAPARNWTAGGVVLNAGETLFYELPHGTDGTSLDANFWISPVSGTNFIVNHDWVVIATRPLTVGSTQLRVGTNVILSNGQIWNGNDGFFGTTDGKAKTTDVDVFSDRIVSGMTFSAAGPRVNNQMFPTGIAYVTGLRTLQTTTQTHTFAASQDTYIDETINAASGLPIFTYLAVANGAGAPTQTANSLRLEKVVTNATSTVSSILMLAPVKPFAVDPSGNTSIGGNGTGVLGGSGSTGKLVTNVDTGNPLIQEFATRRADNVTATQGSQEFFGRQRGTLAIPVVVTTDDNLTTFNIYGFDSVDYAISSQMIFDAEGTIASNQIPGRIRWLTANSSGTLVERMRVDSTGEFLINTTSDGTNDKLDVKDGHIANTMTTAPTTTLCGNNPTPVGTDMDGSITATGVGVTTCTLEFNLTWNTIYGCVVTNGETTTTPTYISAISTSAVTFTFAAVTNPILYYHCAGR